MEDRCFSAVGRKEASSQALSWTQGPFGNDGVGNTGLLGPRDCMLVCMLASWHPSSSHRFELSLELLLL